MDTSLRSTQPTRSRDLKETRRKDAKLTTSDRVSCKIIIIIFLDCEDVLLADFPPCGTTINDPYYASLLHRLHSSIREKHRWKLRCGVLLLHDNVPVHKSNITQATVQYTDFTELNRPPYAPDIVCNGYHLFSNLKNFLHGKNFENDNGRESLFGES